MPKHKTLLIIFISLTALFYSAWYLNFPFLSLDWFLYCLAWIPLIVILISAYKYDIKKNRKQELPNTQEMVKLNIRVEK